MIRIKRWAGHHEVSQSRKVRGPLAWVAVPTRQGRGYCRLVAEHGAAGLGVWLALLELAASRPEGERGTIPGTPEDAAIVSRLATSTVVACSQTLEAIGWIEITDTDRKSQTDAPATSTLPARSERGGSVVVATDRTDVQDGRTDTPPSPPSGSVVEGGGGDGEGPESLLSLIRRTLGTTVRTTTIEDALGRVRAAGLSEGSIRAILADHPERWHGVSPYDWASAVCREHQRKRNGGYAAQDQAIPEAAPPSTISEMAAAANMTLEQYLEYHPELRDLVERRQREAS